MKILAIETSCDETSIAVLHNNKIIKNIVSSQINFHKEYGGVIPEMSSRMHVEVINLILKDIFSIVDKETIDYIAYTKEPGLIGSLQVGELTASAISIALSKPLIPINHIHGHIYAGAITKEYSYPAIAAVVSGGHTQLVLMEKPYDFKIISETVDDAIGEAFDKVGRVLKLKYPGGPKIDKLSKTGKSDIPFPTPIIKGSDNFSFSGLKTSVINYIHNHNQKNEPFKVSDVAASFQKVAVFSVINKLKLAIKKYNPSSIILSGGVAANSLMRSEFVKLHKNAIIPDLEYCTDNAAMIAKACWIKLNKEKGGQ